MSEAQDEAPTWLPAVAENIHQAARLLAEASRFIAERSVRRVDDITLALETAGDPAELRRLRQIEEAARAYIASPGRDDDYEELAVALRILHRCEPAEKR